MRRFGQFASLICFIFIMICPTLQAENTPPSIPVTPALPGVDEHLGANIPLSLQFKDENGQMVKLQDIVTKPTILTLVYFRCPSICSPLLSGVATVVDQLDLEAGRDYQILTISFDDTETPELAKAKKENYLKALNKKIPESAWRFLTGTPESIGAITKSVGFNYRKQGKDFLHPGVIMALGADGKISRYFYGISFLTFDIKLGLIEAAQGQVGPSINKIILYCFSYDPQGRTYVFNTLKIMGGFTLMLIAVFIVGLVVMPKKSK
jgi:protein SCO1/2